VGRRSYYPVPNISKGHLSQGTQGLVPWLRQADFSAVVSAHASAGVDWLVGGTLFDRGLLAPEAFT
jgi:hypothetical protein